MPKIAEPATIAVAPAAAACAAVVAFSPPSTSITGSRPRSAHIARNAPDLGQHLGQEGLAAEAGIDRHHQDDVAEMQDIFDQLRRARRIEHHARLLAERADLAQHPMQMDRRAGLGLDQQMIGAGLGEVGEIALRLDDHQMNVERLCRRAADRLQHDRPDGDVGHETAVHHIDMDPVGAGRVDGADLLAQAREIGRQNRGRDDDRGRRHALTALRSSARPGVIALRRCRRFLRRLPLDRRTRTTRRPAGRAPPEA